MVDVVLIFMLPNFNYNIKFQPQGVLYLAAALEKENVDVKILDMTINFWSKEKTLKFLLKEKPKIVGIGAMSNQLRDAVVYAKYFKDNGLQSKIVLGGPHVTLCPDFVKKFKMFDYGFVGEGELTFPKMVNDLIRGKKVKKIVYGKKVENLDSLPLPAYHLLEMKKYRMPHTSKIFSTMITTRGCPYSCDFCNVPKLSGRNVRFKSANTVVEEVRLLNEKFGIEWIMFTDENFTIYEKRVAKICHLIKKERIDVEWMCETRNDLVNRKLLSTMYKAGCRGIGFGVETGAESVRKKVKGTSPTDKTIIRSFNLCNEIGIKAIAFLMFGYPGETKEDMKKTSSFPHLINADSIFSNPNFFLPKTPIFEKSVRDGLIKKNMWNKYASGDMRHVPIYLPNGMTHKELLKIINNCDTKFYLRPSSLSKRLKINNFNDLRLLVRNSKDFLVEFNDFADHVFKSDYQIKRFLYPYYRKR